MLIYHDAEVSSDGTLAVRVRRLVSVPIGAREAAISGARGRDVLIRLELNAGLLDRKAL